MANPKRVGATIERTAWKRMIGRLRSKYSTIDETQLSNKQAIEAILSEVDKWVSERFERISKKKGGL